LFRLRCSVRAVLFRLHCSARAVLFRLHCSVRAVLFRLHCSVRAVFFFFLREPMHLRIQPPRGSWYVGLRGARRDNPLNPHGGRNMMIYEKAVTRQVAQFTLEDVGH
jgi:hypothetical protein